jgi:hypothetical protein
MKMFNPNNAFEGFTMPNWLAKKSDISSNAKLLYAKLAYMSGRNGFVFAKNSYLADEFSWGLSKLKEVLNELHNAELIISERYYDGLKRVWIREIRFVYWDYMKLYNHGVENPTSYEVGKTPFKGSEKHPLRGRNSHPLYKDENKKENKKENSSSVHAHAQGEIRSRFESIKKKSGLTVPEGLFPILKDFFDNHTIQSEETLQAFIEEQAKDLKVLLEHGTEKRATEWLKRIGQRGQLFRSKAERLVYAIHNPYNSRAFQQAWKEWVLYREDFGHPLPQSVHYQTKQINHFVEQFGDEHSFILALKYSIANGYRGIIAPPKNTSKEYLTELEMYTYVYEGIRSSLKNDDDEESTGNLPAIAPERN